MSSAVRAVAVLGLTASFSCGSPVPAAPSAPIAESPATRLPIGPHIAEGDELFRWRMRLAGVRVAEIEMRIAPVHDVIRVVSTTRAVGMARVFRTFRAQMVTLIEGASGATRSALIETRGQGKFRRTSLRMVGEKTHVTTGDGQTSRRFSRQSIAGLEPLSSESFLLATRAWIPAAGQRALAAVIGTRNMWLIELTAEPAKMITTPMGPRRARELRGKARKLDENGGVRPNSSIRRLSIFVSDDEGRLPLRVVTDLDGPNATVELVSHRVEP